jgi:hypothetical protein
MVPQSPTNLLPLGFGGMVPQSPTNLLPLGFFDFVNVFSISWDQDAGVAELWGINYNVINEF